jgi:23S rRNA (uracil1939-C5)-methyltransferase
VVLDPPRRGARPQAEVLAKSTVRTVAYVSCDIGTFARDARLLVNGGYVLQKVVPVDQFLWSAHVELVGVFTKEIKRR